jgi:adenosine deaminase
VPVALSTDDEGVSRIDLTHEYQRAVDTFGLAYPELKELVRNSIEYSFLPGASLWGEKRAGYGNVAEPCGNDAPGAATPSQACVAFIAGSEKAKQQWELEARFQFFEATH